MNSGLSSGTILMTKLMSKELKKGQSRMSFLYSDTSSSYFRRIGSSLNIICLGSSHW